MSLDQTTESKAWDVYAERLHAQRMLFVQFQKDYGAAVIRGLFLLNGGAALAVLTLLGSDAIKPGGGLASGSAILLNGARLGLISFCYGLIASVLASTFGWVNFNAIIRAEPDPLALYKLKHGEEHKVPKFRRCVIKATFFGAPIVCLGSAYEFLRGGLFVAHAMGQLAALGH